MKANLILMHTLPLSIFCFFAFSVAAEARDGRDLGNCTAIKDGSSLRVIGNEIANIIDIIGSEHDVTVICDGATETFTGINQMTVEAGDGDDTVSIDESDGLGAIGIHIFGQNGNDWTKSQELRTGKIALQDHEFDGGLGVDTFLIASEELADRFDIAQGTETNSVEVQVTDVATGTQLQYTVVAGKDDDFVRLENQTQGEFFDVFFTAHFNNGDDLFEGIGQIRDASLLPGRGFDTARGDTQLSPFRF
jgi:hypothetical protein